MPLTTIPKGGTLRGVRLAIGTFVVVAAGACSNTELTVVPARRASNCDRSAFQLISPEVLSVEPRAGCLEGPWVAWPGDVTAPALVHLTERSGNTFWLRVGDGLPLARSMDGLPLRSLHLRLGELRGVLDVLDGRCDPFDPPGTAEFGLGVAICAAPLVDLAARIAAVWSEQSELRERSMLICVRLKGRSGPRCSPADPACGPQFVNREIDAGAPPSDAERCPAFPYASRFQLGGCTYDGECEITGCGNVCAQWSLAPFSYICPGFSRAHWCGCVDGRCAWFYVPP